FVGCGGGVSAEAEIRHLTAAAVRENGREVAVVRQKISVRVAPRTLSGVDRGRDRVDEIGEPCGYPLDESADVGLDGRLPVAEQVVGDARSRADVLPVRCIVDL